ncbi:MAG: dienelactone hydrolase family protein [Chloroflexi bacterium]|nr:dienelactone hydrolase family protein [Chloroflexota bacterium]
MDQSFVRTTPGQIEERVVVPADKVSLEGDLFIPRNVSGLVIFAHGSGSSRKSPRNIQVARSLQTRGLATLLFDLLTLEEEAADELTARYRFNIPLLGKRMVHAISFAKESPRVKRLSVGLFGASTGAAAALVAAAERPEDVQAVVSRGGRPDLAGRALPLVKSPTLLIVGGQDTPVIGMNKEAMALIKAEKRLVIVPGATHLFEEPGALDEVARLAGEWFNKYLGPIR